MEEIKIFGHKNPDTDTIMSSLVLEDLENKAGFNKVKAYRLGKINRISSGDRYVKDSTDLAETIVEDKDIVGKVNSNYGKIGAVIKFLTTIPAMVTIVLVVLIYFALSREQ